MTDETPEVRSYLQKYLYNKGSGWELSKLCDSCVMEDISAGKCTQGGSDDKCTPCRPIEESCVYQPPSAPIIDLDDEPSGAGVGVPSYGSQPAASAMTYQLPVSMCSEAVASYWSTAPSESEASSIYGGTGYDRASFSTASSSIPDDYTTGSHTPVLPYSTHAATNQYGESSGTFMMPTGSYTKRNA
ncbi:hypothetical protein PG996_010730 [Apiospora saccharicola]|uniref:Zn(2)-C6 fungal-type domain-containing protein n=1 Tax=Apiospora saccharicola TaxID=335842 RepID=A0ABR1URX4_9PEZI